ncbi:replication initiator protein A [Intestinimonas sp. MSJ-38]|uniref:replication initiator protein A n=1 Tax=Intestinimonas sp. MSJ-38 TaxID=2841532 RepID=UPI001C116472|nr:replication initiator protein A [Intestinimonas sp. MSJ-38]MBU5431942.1 replication initiator protein A [Intestinimonas sp. MSJ-38]
MPQAIVAYHLGMDAEQYAFFRIPKLLITEPYFRRLSTDAKLLYGLMLDRMSLSMRNGWMDDDGHVYIYFTLEKACEQLCCKTDKAVKLFAELDSAKGVGLIRRVKQGLGRPVKIYVLRFMGIEDEPGEDTPEPEPPSCRNPDFGKTECNKTDKNNTELNNTDSSIHPGAQPEEMIEEYRKEIRENIEYDRLQKYFPASYTPKQMEDVIIKLLEGWHRKRQQEQSR